MKIHTGLLRETPLCTISGLYINWKFECYILQDGKTGGGLNGKGRIPPGIYRLALRTVGEKHAAYTKRFEKTKGWHRGMIELVGVPNFTAILIHIGNVPHDTLGCLLTGTGEVKGKCMISGSSLAYERLYPKVRDAILSGEGATIDIEY